MNNSSVVVTTDKSSRTQYLLCLPRGGFNDMISVIWKCYEYARAKNRRLVVDTRESFMKTDLRRYLDFRAVPTIDDRPLEQFYSGSYRDTYPPTFHDRWKDARPHYSGDMRCYMHDGMRAAADLSKDYSEEVVVYCNCKSTDSEAHMDSFLRLCRATPVLCEVFQSRRARLPSSYIGIHIRNTDRKSDVEAFIRDSLNNLKPGPVFLASDNIDTLARVKGHLEARKMKVHTFARIPQSGGKCIHYHHTNIPKEELNIDLLIDFFLLVFSRTYFFSCQDSGFSRSVQRVRSHMNCVEHLFTPSR